ncbi:MAG: hypothetical protein FJX74_06905 [Armatimonadetes bacterium]|nr:hypothetical protein [Armatimonadota bacterium]
MAKYAGLLRDLNAAGWEPITHARVDPPTIRLERFGSAPHVYLVAHNPTDAPVTAKVTFDARAMGLGAVAGLEMRLGEAATPEGAAIAVRLDGKETAVLEVKGGQ